VGGLHQPYRSRLAVHHTRTQIYVEYKRLDVVADIAYDRRTIQTHVTFFAQPFFISNFAKYGCEGDQGKLINQDVFVNYVSSVT